MYIMEKFIKYQWIVYLLGWFVFQLFPAYFGLTSTSEEFLIPFLFIVGIIVIAICSFNFGVANGKLAGWQMFVFAVIVNVVVALATFIFLLGQSWHN